MQIYDYCPFKIFGGAMDIQIEQIQNMIYVVRGHRVMLDSDLATLYSVDTKRLNEQVRNMVGDVINLLFLQKMEWPCFQRS